MSDLIRFSCDACGKRLKAPPDLSGRRVKCGCGRSQVVPEFLPPEVAASVPVPKPPHSRGKSRTAVYGLVGVGVLLLAGVGGWLAIGLLNGRSQEVWVGDLTTEDLAVPAGEGRLWVTAYSQNDDAVGAIVELSLPPAERDRVEAALKHAVSNVRVTYERVKEGWLIPGSLATRVVPNNGLVGVQAARFPFSPGAKKLAAGLAKGDESETDLLPSAFPPRKMEIGNVTSWPQPTQTASNAPPAPPKQFPASSENPKVVPAPPATTRPIEDFAGQWRGMMPRSALGRQEDIELTIEFDKKGDAVPDFRTASGERVFFTGAVSTRIRKEGNQYRVVLRRDWAVDLSPDGKVMTWTEKGGDKVTFTREQSVRLPATGDAPKAPEEVAELIEKGGKNWSAPASAPDLNFLNRTAGDRIWIWPAEDHVIEIKAIKPHITLAWRLRPGQKPVDAADVVMAEFQGTTAGNKFAFRGSTEGISIGATEGKCEITPGMAINDYRGEAELLVFISVKGVQSVSNLLRVKVRIVD